MSDLTDTDVAIIQGRLHRNPIEYRRLWWIATDHSIGEAERSRAAATARRVLQQIHQDIERFSASGRCRVCLKPPERAHTHGTRFSHEAREFGGEDSPLCPELAPQE